MAEAVQHGVDSEQVNKATKALLAYCKTKENANSLLLNEHEPISLMLTVWRIPAQEKSFRIPLPHGIRPDTCDVCLFTRDEPNMSIEQTEKFYKKLLSQHGVTQISEVIPLKKMKKEYKPFEAKRRLLGSFDLFLADDRIRRLLPSQIGKHFYKQKREPQSVDLKSKNLAAVLNRHIQGTQLHVTNKGCCYSIRVGHIGMKVNDIVENTMAVTKVLAEKLPMKWKNVKVLHLKTQTSVALPIYSSSFDSIKQLHLVQEEKDKMKKKKKGKSAKKNKPAISDSKENGGHITGEKKVTATPQKKNSESDETEEEIPQLVPIEEPVSAKKTKKKKKDVQEKNSKESEENVKVSSTVKSTPKKRKANESDEGIKTPSKHKKEVPAKEKSKKPEEPETPPKLGLRKKTPKKTPGKSAVKLTKSARKAPQTPKLKQKKKMKTPQSL